MVTGKEDRKHGCPRDTEKRLSLTVLGEASGAVKALAGRQSGPVVTSPVFEFWLHHLVALGHWASYLTSFRSSTVNDG